MTDIVSPKFQSCARFKNEIQFQFPKLHLNVHESMVGSGLYEIISDHEVLE